MAARSVQQDVLAWLATQKTESGTALSAVYGQELQMDPLTVARFMIYRDMLAAAGPEIPAPSLTGTFLALRGASMLGHVLGGAIGGASGQSGGGMSRGLKGGGVGAVIGLGSGVGNEIQQLINGLTTFLRPAIFLTWWAPYIFGIINMVLLGLFPLVLLWSLTPGQQFRPILLFFALLFVTSATPLWWALVDVAARLGGSLDINMMTAVPQWLEAAAARLVITVVGIFVVLVTMAVMVLWTGFAAVRGIFRAALA
jgi:hypothetical protein